MNLTRSYCLGFILVMSCAHGVAADPPTEPMPLAIVHTWGDLRAQPPVTPAPVAKDASTPPVTYRLGIDSTEGKLYGGAVLYCLANDGKPAFWARENLGPFLVDVQGPPRTRYAKDAQMIEARFPREEHLAGTEVLYLKTIPFHQAGDYTITVKKPVGEARAGKFETVAVISVKVPDKSGPVWSPWPLNAADGAVGLLARDDDPAYGVIGVANPSAGVAIPKMPEWVGSGVTPPAQDHPLPQLMPAEPDPGVKLQVSGALLIVMLDHGVYPYFVDEKFITRWWINGKPFTPKLAPPQFSSDYYMRHNGMMLNRSATEIGFQVEFHPEILGAKKGNAIGVQLLLCPQGSECSGPEPMQMPLERAMEPNNIDARFLQSRMSNRLTFIYTGDPARMAPLPLTASSLDEEKGR